jgi:hypothetical protein
MFRRTVSFVSPMSLAVRADRSKKPDQKGCEISDVVARAHEGGPEASKPRAFARE